MNKENIKNDTAQLRAEKSENLARDAGGALAAAPCSAGEIKLSDAEAISKLRQISESLLSFSEEAERCVKSLENLSWTITRIRKTENPTKENQGFESENPQSQP